MVFNVCQLRDQMYVDLVKTTILQTVEEYTATLHSRGILAQIPLTDIQAMMPLPPDDCTVKTIRHSKRAPEKGDR